MSELIFLGHSTPEQDRRLLVELDKAHAQLEASKRILAWCPDCDRETAHLRLSPTCRECTLCGELSADTVPVPSPVDSPA